MEMVDCIPSPYFFVESEPMEFRPITFSPAYTIVPTYECFNRCRYCNFREEPGKSPWISLEEVTEKLRSLQSQNQNSDFPQAIEILILSGEVHPQSSRRAEWFEHIYQICEKALEFDFLPHTNAGPLSYDEMQRLKAVNVSMGLMLEQLTPKLLETVHQQALSKQPEIRLQQLNWAGKLNIPFTTGLLLGIGETEADRWETLEAIAQVHQQWGHIQEVILQPYSPGSQEMWANEGFRPAELIEIVTVAREILPSEITIQVPPNLISDPQFLWKCLDAGARDLGGIVPRDEVNPDYGHQDYETLATELRKNGWQLVPRLPIYPHYDRWLPEPLQLRVTNWRSRIQSYSPNSSGVL